jgi:hypothetical protein
MTIITITTTITITNITRRRSIMPHRLQSGTTTITTTTIAVG